MPGLFPSKMRGERAGSPGACGSNRPDPTFDPLSAWQYESTYYHSGIQLSHAKVLSGTEADATQSCTPIKCRNNYEDQRMLEPSRSPSASY